MREEKARLRKLALGRREDLEPDARAGNGRAIVRGIVALAAYKEAATVMAYVGFGSELRTDEFLHHALNAEKILLLPRVNRRKGMLDVYEVKDPARDLEAGTWGIREPRPDRCRPADPRITDLVLVPGLAFDARGGRLGYGAGFYDRLLSANVPPDAPLVAGAFEAQMVEEVPMHEHDVPVDVVITEVRSYRPLPPRSRTKRRSP